MPLVALGVFWLCVPSLRLLGIAWLAFITLAFLWQPLRVRVTPREVVVSGPLRSVRYDLRDVKYVTEDEVPAGHGTRMASVRLDFFHRKSAQIAGFGSRTKLLWRGYICCVASWISRQTNLTNR